jgi:ribosomal protein L20A (L18A)
MRTHLASAQKARRRYIFINKIKYLHETVSIEAANVTTAGLS